VRARFTGGLRVRQPGAEPPDGWPTTWPLTVADTIARPDEMTPEIYIERVRAWASSAADTARDRPL
jgi:hypothetical protein